MILILFPSNNPSGYIAYSIVQGATSSGTIVGKIETLVQTEQGRYRLEL